MAFLDKRSERPRVVAPKRGFYSEAVANAPLIEEDKAHGQGPGARAGAWKRPMLALQVRTELYAPVLAHVAPPPTPPSPASPQEQDGPQRDFWAFAEEERAYVSAGTRGEQAAWWCRPGQTRGRRTDCCCRRCPSTGGGRTCPPRRTPLDAACRGTCPSRGACASSAT